MTESAIVRSDRRQSLKRRTQERQNAVYLTRREWIIAEFIIGVVSFAVGITGISPGMVAATLQITQINIAWFTLFCGTGAAFILLSYMETRCRSRLCPRETLLLYAHVRFSVHCVNCFCWVMAFLWFHISGSTVASIYYEALPIAFANAFALVEHAKAMWLKPAQAKTTSLTVAGLSYLRAR